jgi:hypothetical protein
MTALNHAGNEYAQRLAAQSRTPEQYKAPVRVYFHHHNYAKFHFDLGGSNVKTVAFANYRYITDDKREQDQLDLVADAPGTFIYTMPESDVARAMAQELQQEATKDVLRTAAAHAATNNQMFDPNSPIVPVNVQHVHQTPGLSVSQVPQTGVGVVGLASSLSGTQATEPVHAQATTSAQQTKAPSAADEAAARLATMTAQAKAS